MEGGKTDCVPDLLPPKELIPAPLDKDGQRLEWLTRVELFSDTGSLGADQQVQRPPVDHWSPLRLHWIGFVSCLFVIYMGSSASVLTLMLEDSRLKEVMSAWIISLVGNAACSLMASCLLFIQREELAFMRLYLIEGCGDQQRQLWLIATAGVITCWTVVVGVEVTYVLLFGLDSKAGEVGSISWLLMLPFHSWILTTSAY